MKIKNIKYDIVSEENDYMAESRAQKMLEMANELRAQRDKAQAVYEPATQEIGWKKVQVFLENIDRQIGPLLYALKEIKEAEGSTGRFCVRVFTPEEPITLWEVYADSNGKIEVQARKKGNQFIREFPSYWVKENGEPRGVTLSEEFYGEKGLVVNIDFSGVLKEIDKTIEYEYNLSLDKIKNKQSYYENSFKKMVDSDKDVSLGVLMRDAKNRAEQSTEKGTVRENDFTMD